MSATASDVGMDEIRAMAMPAVLGFGDGDRARAPTGADETTLDDATTDAGPVLALYRAPWVAFLDDGEADGEESAAQWLAEWIRFHRELLALHRRHPERVMLVNAGRLDDSRPLLEHLRAMGVDCDEGDGDGDDIDAASVDAGNATAALHSLLAAGMANACPDAWTVYEELESRALLLGREPEFRGADGVADLDDPGAMLAGFAALRGAIASGLEQARALPPPGTPRSDALLQENEMLGLHLEQVLEELQFHSDRGRQLGTLLQEAGDVSDAARMLISELQGGDRAPG